MKHLSTRIVSSLILSMAFGALPAMGASSAASGGAYGSAACAAGERWSYGSGISPEMRREFEMTLAGQASAVHGFALGNALERSGSTASARAFGRYWQSRALLGAGLVSSAADGFRDLAAGPVDRETVGVTLGALECLSQIHEDHAGIAVPAELVAKLPGLLSLVGHGPGRHAIWEFADQALIAQIEAARPASEMRATLDSLRGGGAYELYALGLYSAYVKDHANTIASLGTLLSRKTSMAWLPPTIGKQLNHVRLLLARAYYATKQFDRAAETYHLVERKSNELPEMLSELSWSYLQSEKYPDAVGTATGLHVGAMRGTFAPEGPIVMAMALNELCQYPDSLRAVQIFKRNYHDAYFWLKSWESAPSSSREALYPLAIQFLKKDVKDRTLPDRVAEEWIRSNVFIAGQEEIRRLAEERSAADAFVQAGNEEQRKLGEEIRDLASDLKEHNVGIREEAGGLRIYAPASAQRSEDFAKLSAKVTTYNRLLMAASAWRPLVESIPAAVSAKQDAWVAKINSALAGLSARMLSRLDEVVENTKLIEVEIFNGASHDMIWRNAHPDYAQVEKDMKVASQQPAASRVWNWGKIDLSRKTEVWEDELGAFKADLRDNCASKDKYLALKRAN